MSFISIFLVILCLVFLILFLAEIYVGILLNEKYKKARGLVEDALFLRMHGERPPGAEAFGDVNAETWKLWHKQAEAFLREED